MAYETFIWRAINQPAGSVSYSVLVAQFGDGYEQAAADGINNKKQSWPLTFQGSEDEIAPILAFLDAHGGYRKFYWTPPLGVQGLYVCKGFSPTPQGGPVYTINATFEQRFAA